MNSHSDISFKFFDVKKFSRVLYLKKRSDIQIETVFSLSEYLCKLSVSGNFSKKGSKFFIGKSIFKIGNNI